MAKKVQAFTPEIAARLVLESPYVRGETISQKQQRFVVIFAVTYGASDGVETAREAIEGFRELITADDWEERTFQVFDAKTGKVFGYVPEENR